MSRSVRTNCRIHAKHLVAGCEDTKPVLIPVMSWEHFGIDAQQNTGFVVLLAVEISRLVFLCVFLLKERVGLTLPSNVLKAEIVRSQFP